MNTPDIDRVLTVFLGIGDRDKDLAIKNMHPTKYKQHNPRAMDGIEGVKEWIDKLPLEKSSLRTVRAFQDGPYVFTHTIGDVLGPHVFFDIFRMEDGLIVEHWVFQEQAVPANESGHTQVDGPTDAQNLHDTEKNKSFVRDYYDAVHVGGDHSKIPQFASEDTIRHEPGVRDGLAAFLHDVDAFNRPGKPSRTIDEVEIILGQGDLVLVAAKGTLDAEPCVYIDLYRVEDDKLVEHWGFIEKVPPPETWKNDNGML